VNNQGSGVTNIILWMILLALVGGAGAVTGFFSSIFWIIIFLVLIGSVIWFFTKYPYFILIIGLLIIYCFFDYQKNQKIIQTCIAREETRRINFWNRECNRLGKNDNCSLSVDIANFVNGLSDSVKDQCRK